MISGFLLFFFILYFIIQISLIVLLFLPDKRNKIVPIQNTPFVSIMVAVRNEEKNILNCLNSLLKQDYSTEKYEVLVGNDHSTDKTWEIMETFNKSNSNFKCFHISNDIGKAKGKSNVLAQLCHHAKGDIFLFTDGDITVPKTWVSRLVESFVLDKNVIMNSGATYIKGSNFQQIMQGLEWVFSLGIFKASTEAGIPVSAVGNNMGLRREAYFKTGGYENMNFNMVEDYQLFCHVMKQPGKFYMDFDKQSLNISAPAATLKEFLNQKNRWMQGAITCPWYHKIIMGLPFLFPFIAIAMGIINLNAALFILLLRITLEWIYLSIVLKKLSIKTGFEKILVFPIYYLFMQQITVASTFLSGRVVWKGRTYRGIIFGSHKQ